MAGAAVGPSPAPEPTEPPMVVNTPPNDGHSAAEADRDNGPHDAGADRPLPITAVRYGQMGFVGEFTHPPQLEFTCGGRVVIQTKRGIEIGEHVPLTCPANGLSVSREQVTSFVSASGPEYCTQDCGRVLREATEEDLAEYDRILAGAEDRCRTCQELAARYNLEMRVVSCEPLFGGERIIFYFVAEGRVDFRALVKDLAREFQTRIEMRQVGARDEARLVADYETCGRECCCKNFLKVLKPVSMKMAKMQKATLDPSKVSGRCGRLKCCLRFEHSSYEELDRLLPRVGAKVRTRLGEGTVIARQILTQLLQIETEAGGRMVVGVEDLLKPGEEPEAAAPPAEPAHEPATPTPPQSKDRSRSRGRGGRRRSRREAPAGPAEPAEPTPAPPKPTETPAGTAEGRPTAKDGSAPSSEPTKRKRRKRRRGQFRPHGHQGGEKTDGGDGPPPAGNSGNTAG